MFTSTLQNSTTKAQILEPRNISKLIRFNLLLNYCDLLLIFKPGGDDLHI